MEFYDLRGFSGKVLGKTGNGFYGDEAFCCGIPGFIRYHKVGITSIFAMMRK